MFRILFISRGLGLGHLTRDLALAERLMSQGCDVSFATYGTALAVAKNRAKIPVFDLLGSSPLEAGLLRQELRVLATEEWTHVISDEELYVGLFARSLNIPKVVYITNWLPRFDDSFQTSLLRSRETLR